MLRMVDTIYRNDTDVDTIYAERGEFLYGELGEIIFLICTLLTQQEVILHNYLQCLIGKTQEL